MDNILLQKKDEGVAESQMVHFVINVWFQE